MIISTVPSDCCNSYVYELKDNGNKHCAMCGQWDGFSAAPDLTAKVIQAIAESEVLDDDVSSYYDNE